MQNEIIPLVSFPKSGNTWMRFILSNIFKKDKNYIINFETINDISPTSHTQELNSFTKLLKDGSPLFIKEHYDYYSMPYKDFNKAIYIYRNGFDTLLSYWHFRNAQSPNKYPNIETFSKYYWIEFGHWGEHLYSWLIDSEVKKQHSIFPIKYEELLEKPVEIIDNCMKFLGYNIPIVNIEEAIALSSKDKMKNMKGSDKFMKSKDKNFHFVRNATKSEGEKKLSDICKSNFIKYEINYEMMIKFNYLNNESKWKELFKIKNIPLKDNIFAHLFDLKYRVFSKIKDAI